MLSAGKQGIAKLMKRTSGAIVLALVFSIAIIAPALAMPPPAAGEATITYRLDASTTYRGAFHDSKEAWNKLALRHSAPLLRYDADGRGVDILVRSVCGRSDVGFYEYRSGADLLWINRCAGLTWQERRKVYSHELGHAYLGPDHPMGLTVMHSPLEDQSAVYPTAKDERKLARIW